MVGLKAGWSDIEICDLAPTMSLKDIVAGENRANGDVLRRYLDEGILYNYCRSTHVVPAETIGWSSKSDDGDTVVQLFS